jgi:hypothetical protein
MDIISLLKAERDKIARQLNGLNAALAAFGDSYSKMSRPRRKLSAASRAKIARAQKARWSKQKSGAKTVRKNAPKRHISPQGRARIAAAARARWAKVKQKKAA